MAPNSEEKNKNYRGLGNGAESGWTVLAKKTKQSSL